MKIEGDFGGVKETTGDKNDRLGKRDENGVKNELGKGFTGGYRKSIRTGAVKRYAVEFKKQSERDVGSGECH